MLTVEHLTYRYSRRGAPVLRGVDLTLESGEIGILLGCNGSGKTTLFKNLLGICTPDSGSIRFDGQELTALSRRRRAQYIAYVPQDIRFGELTVFDSVLLGRLSRFGLQAGPADRAAAARVLADMGLAPLAARSVAELSGGERQKVAIARALAQEPRLLVLDEPTGNLDVSNEHLLMREAKKAAQERHIAVLSSLHDLNQALAFGDRFFFLKDGVIRYAVTRDAVTEDMLCDVFGAALRLREVDGTRVVLHGPAD
jgi:iron complex transport system ATP-binding protein